MLPDSCSASSSSTAGQHRLNICCWIPLLAANFRLGSFDELSCMVLLDSCSASSSSTAGQHRVNVIACCLRCLGAIASFLFSLLDYLKALLRCLQLLLESSLGLIFDERHQAWSPKCRSGRVQAARLKGLSKGSSVDMHCDAIRAVVPIVGGRLVSRPCEGRHQLISEVCRV